MSVFKSLLAAVGVLTVLSCPFFSASATPSGGYLDRSVKDVPPLAVIDGGAAVDLAPVPANAMLAAEESLPASYRSNDYGYITPAKSQQDTNACWAFSAIACAEADAIKNHGFAKDTDFSEWALAYFQFYGVTDPLGLLAGDYLTLTNNYMMTSSNLFLTAQSLSNWRGIHAEEEAPLAHVMGNHEAGLPPELCYNDVLHLENAYLLPTKTDSDRAAVKASIRQFGAASAGIYYNEIYLNSANAAYYNGSVLNANHAVTLVGWDDHYSRLNFSASSRPAKDGAWLVKNSWGTAFGNGGLFWVSYYDISLCSEDVTVLDFAPADNFDRNYQYDGAPGFATLTFQNGSTSVAAVFTAEGDEQLEAASLFHYADSATAYTLNVYKNPSSANPASGTKVATVSGTFPTAGLYTVRLASPVELQKGDRFSAVFSLSCDVGLRATICIPGEYLQSDGSLIAYNSGQAGQGFYLQKGKWRDLYTDYNASPRLHAYTVLKSAPVPSSTTTETTTATTTLAPSTTDTATTAPTVAPSGSAADDGLWGDANADGAVNMKDVLAVRKAIAGLAPVASEQNADVTPDGVINMKDVLVLRKFLAGLPF